MPLYDFECKKCGHVNCKLLRWDDGVPEYPQHCDEAMAKMIGTPSFKGSKGFYKTDMVVTKPKR
jgi:putative FmdB family regulatory protein